MKNYKTYARFFKDKEINDFVSEIAYDNFHGFLDCYVLDELWFVRRFWNSKTPVFVHAPCGAGKTTFMEDYACELNNTEFLFVSNRIALNTQMKKRLCVKLGEEHLLEELTIKGLERLEKIKNVTVLSYQALAHKKPKDLEQYQIVLADEVHAIYDEATYFPRSLEALANIVRMRNAIRVYFSATPKKIFNKILSLERDLDSSRLSLMVTNPRFLCPIFYDFGMTKRNFEDIFFFDQLDDLRERVTIDKDAKTLIFVETIEDGEKVKSVIESWGKSAKLITSKSKDGEEGVDEYLNIVEKEFFEVPFLICTKVLQEGCNIKMKNLRNIVMLTYHTEDSLTQCIGRHRMISSTHTVNLFIKILTENDLKNQIKNWKVSLSKIYDLQGMCMKEKDYLIDSLELKIFENLFYSEKGQLYTNPLAEDYFKDQIRLYEAMLAKIKEFPFISAQVVLSWIASEKELNEKMILPTGKEKHDIIDSLCKTLNDYTQIEISGEIKEEFRKTFTALWNQLSNESSDTLGAKLINQKIKKMNLPFLVKTKRGVWFVERIDEGENNE